MASEEPVSNGDPDVLNDALFLELKAIAQSVPPEGRVLDIPPDSVWEGIDAELSTDPAIGGGATVSSLDQTRHRRRPSGILFGAIAASIVAVVALASLLSTNGDTVVGSAELASLDAPGDRVGSARIVERGDQLVLDLSWSQDLTSVPRDAFLEVWVIDTDVQGMHSLGIVDGDGEFVLPAGLDPQQFPIIDVSVEPIDGDPTHSGVSLYRGQIT